MKNKGITLVALIITIIVLLILAGVSISLLTGQDSIIGKAKEGKTRYENASKEEVETINGLIDIINESVQTPAGNPVAGIQVGETVSNIKQIADGTGEIVPVPVGFSYLTGTKLTGFVIKNDEDNNEFVWIPCDLASNNPSEGTLIYQTYEWNAGETAVNFTEYYTADGIENENIIREINLSIGTHKGYYISRYEAGTEAQRIEEGQELTTVLSKATGTPIVYGYNHIDWTDANEQAGGVYNKIDDNVQSRLINARGWDTALKFIEQADSTYPTDSFGKGWYGDNYDLDNVDHETGKPVGENVNMIKNIYDMGGNLYEWTADQYNLNIEDHGRRGGYYWYSDSSHSAAYRSNFDFMTNSSAIGFRFVLYL